MKWTHWKLGTVLLGVLILLCLMWWPEAEAPQHLQPAITTTDISASPVPTVNPPSTRRHFHPEECSACPDMDLKAMKRIPRGSPSDCQEFLMDAAESGNPDPDTSHLEDCTGWSPLHFAETPEQIQALLEAGVDPNVQDLEGRTPLYLQAQKAMMMPSENGQSIIQKLLEAGADPLLQSHEGRNAIDIARLSNTSGASLVRLKRQFRKRFQEQGMTMEEAIARNPALKEALDHFSREPQIASEILDSLFAAIRQTQSPTQ